MLLAVLYFPISAGRHLTSFTSLVSHTRPPCEAGTTLRVTLYSRPQHVMGTPPSFKREERSFRVSGAALVLPAPT
jgi:hypothetical protein